MTERIMNLGSDWRPDWVVYSKDMREELFRNPDFSKCQAFLRQQLLQEKQCPSGSCED